MNEGSVCKYYVNRSRIEKQKGLKRCKLNVVWRRLLQLMCVTSRASGRSGWQLLDEGARERSCAQSCVWLPHDVLGAVRVVANSAHEHERVLAVATDRFDYLIQLRVHGDTLLSHGEVLTQRLILEEGLACANRTVTHDRFALAMPITHLQTCVMFDSVRTCRN